MRVIIDDEPIDAEWLESEGWKYRNGSDTLFHPLMWWNKERGLNVGFGTPTTIKTRGELRTFLAFFGGEP